MSPTPRRSIDLTILGVGLLVLVVASLLAMSDEVAAWEEELFRLLNELPDWLEPIVFVPMQAGALAAVPVAGMLAWLVWRSWRPAAAIAGAGVVVWLLAKVVKALVERERPAGLLDDVILRPDWTGLGYPSGHVAVVFAMVTVAAPYVSRPWKIGLWTLAVVTSLARIYVGAHLPLDAVGGAGLGLAVGAAVNLLIPPRRPADQPAAATT